MSDWQKPSVLRVPQAICEEYKEQPLSVYREGCLAPSDEDRIKKTRVYVSEALANIEGSLLVVGSGHSDYCNTISEGCPKLNVIASDVAEEAATGLLDSVSFISVDILSPIILDTKFDYVLTINFLERFTVDHLFNVVWPRLVGLASKAVITVVTYGVVEKEGTQNKCKFYEDDEFAYMQDKYKVISGGKEIVFWKDVEVP